MKLFEKKNTEKENKAAQKIKETLSDRAVKLVKIIRHDIGWKILSLVCAVILWSYIISVDTTITRVKTLANVNVITSGVTTLQNNGLAVLTDTSAIPDIHVKVESSQSNYSKVTNDSVRVELDVSGIRGEGMQKVELSASCSYGDIVDITPSFVEVEVEGFDTKYVPVNVKLENKAKNYWYSVSRTNPTQITVSGPTSLVQKVTAGEIVMDVKDARSSFNKAMRISLLDAEGKELEGMLTKSISFATVGVDVYPSRQLPILTDLTTSGTLPEGYEITGISVQPDTVTVAAEQSLLSELDGLSIEPVSVEGRTGSFSTIAALRAVKDVKYMSSEQVNVTVYISEVNTTKTLSGIGIGIRRASDSRRVTLLTDECDVRVTGAYSVVEKLTEDDITAFVDVAGLDEGRHELELHVVSDTHKDVTPEAEPQTITVVIEKIEDRNDNLNKTTESEETGNGKQ